MKRCPECESTYPDEVNHCYRDGERLLPELGDDDSLVGSLLDGRFRLEARIGVGGMGAVYRGVQVPVGRPVAIKVLNRELARDKAAVQRFFHEARVVSKLRHPNTVTLYDFGQAEGGELFIAMEHLAGQTLEERMSEQPLELETLLDVVDQVCQSLSEAHGLGVVHRDLKPDNVFIDTVAGKHLVKVFDFGIAKVSEGPRLTQAGMVVGTPTFMSPEQAQGFELDARSDLYTLGILLYWLLSGQAPFRGEGAMQVALKQVTERPRPIREVSRYRPLPVSLDTLVMDLLEKRPDRRPQTADEVRRRLRAVALELAESLSTGNGPADPPDPVDWRSSRDRESPPARVQGPPRSLLDSGPEWRASSASASRSADPLLRPFFKTLSGRLFLASGVILALALVIVLTRERGGRDAPASGGALTTPVVEEAVGDAIVEQPGPKSPVIDWAAARAEAENRISGAHRTASIFAGRVAASERESSSAVDNRPPTGSRNRRERRDTPVDVARMDGAVEVIEAASAPETATYGVAPVDDLEEPQETSPPGGPPPDAPPRGGLMSPIIVQ